MEIKKKTKMEKVKKEQRYEGKSGPKARFYYFLLLYDKLCNCMISVETKSYLHY